MYKKLIIVTASAFLLAGCSLYPAKGPSTQELPKQKEAVNSGEAMSVKTIEMSNFAFSPSTLRAKVGEKITVTNRDIAGHTFTSDEEGLFGTSLLGKDQSAIITAPSKPGTYPFHCTPHAARMKGTLVVE